MSLIAGCPSGPSRSAHLLTCTRLAEHFSQILGRDGHHPAVTRCAEAADSPALRRAWASLAGCALKASAGSGLTRCIDEHPVRGALDEWQRLMRVQSLFSQGSWDEAWRSCFARYDDLRPLKSREPHRAKIGEQRYRWCAEQAEAMLERLSKTPRTFACRQILGREPGAGPRPVLYAAGQKSRLPALVAACRRRR